MKNEEADSLFLKVHLSFYKSGLSSKLGSARSNVLLTLATYMNERGGCYPTQRQLAERSGMDLKTINKHINSLLAVRINGKPIVTRELVSRNSYKNSTYIIHPISQISIFKGEIEKLDNDYVFETVRL